MVRDRNGAPAWAGIAAYAALAVWVIVDELLTARTAPAASDWVAFATGAHLLGAADLYSSAAQMQTVRNVLHLDPSVFKPFVSPAIGAWMFKPFAAPGPFVGITLFNTLGALALVVASLPAFHATPRRRLPVRLLLVLLAVWALPGLQNLTQWDPLLLPLLLFAWQAQKQGRPFVAGLLLSRLSS